MAMKPVVSIVVDMVFLGVRTERSVRAVKTLARDAKTLPLETANRERMIVGL
jgi:hypothetical protein